MRNKSKKILLINLIFLTILLKFSFADLIIPKKKPITKINKILVKNQLIRKILKFYFKLIIIKI